MSPRASNVVDDATSDGWETVVEPFGETWNFDENAVLVGTYASSKVVQLPDLNNPNEMRDSNLYEIVTEDGVKHSVWGNYAIDEAFAKIGAGQMVRIEFQGKIKIKNGAQEVNQFVVQTKAA